MNKKTATKISFIFACINLFFCTLNFIKANKQAKIESVSDHEKD